MKKISVIIPVYNTERFLRQCVDSVLVSSYSSLEVILVDDGSPDGSGKICDEYAEKDSRVRVIHKDNGGLSSARNAGLDIATGDYITFVDSDDYVSSNAYEALVGSIEEHGSDIAQMKFKFASVSEAGECIWAAGPVSEKWLGLKSGEWLFEKICKRELDTSVCSKLFSARIFEDLRFRQGVLNEDFLLLSDMLIGTTISVSLIDFAGYYYRMTAGSITRSGFGKSLHDAVYNTEYARERAERFSPALVPVVGAYAAYQARTAILTMSQKQYDENVEFTRYCREVIRKNRKYIKKSFMNKKERVFCFLYVRFPKFTKRMFDLIRSGRR